jgi:mRNA interferase MazF
MPSKTFERYDIVVVPFAFTNKASTKRRPTVVLSSAALFNQPAKHLVLAMVTSATNRAWPFDVPLADLASAGLKVDCAVRFKLFTLDDRLILRQAGSLAAKDKKAVDAAMRALLLS